MARGGGDDRIPLLGGFYQAPSLIANAQRCLNLYPEINQKDAPTPVTHYLTPGIDQLVLPFAGAVRGAYRATNGALYVCIGARIYFIDTNWSALHIGSIGAGTTPVSMKDNGLIVVLVDGTTNGYWWALGGVVVTAIADPAFYGATAVCYLDGFFLFNRIGTNQFYVSPNFWNGLTPFDATYIASKIGGPDQIIDIAVIHREIWLIGAVTTEVWYNAGGADFPFDRLPGVFVEHGMIRGWSLAQADVALFWLGRDTQGQCIVFQGSDYTALRISTNAIEKAMQSYAVNNDAIGFTYQEAGHTFYVLIFPSADKTWVYDMATKLWHERAWIDNNGAEHRIRANCYAFAYNTHVVGDWQNGKLYDQSQDLYDDDGQPILRRRSFPHSVKNGQRVSYASFIADMEVGTPDAATPPGPPVYLRWSDTRGATWSDGVPLEMDFGSTGQYYRSLLVRRLGIARDRVFELYWSFSYKTALQGAWVKAEVAET